MDFATCQPCPAGANGGLCQHIFALLMAIEYYRGKASVLPAAESVTSNPCSWGPSQRDVELKFIFQSVIEKPKAEKRKGKGSGPSLFEARGPEHQTISESEVEEFCRLFPASNRLLLRLKFLSEKNDGLWRGSSRQSGVISTAPAAICC